MRYSRSTKVVAALVAVMLGAAACGDSDDDDAATTTAPAATTNATTASTSGASETSAATASSEPATQEPEVAKVTFAGSQPNAGNWVLQVGEAEGIFEDYGLDFEIIFSGSSPGALAALFGNSVQFTSATYDAAILAHLQNDDLMFIAGGYDVAPFNLVVAPDITSVEDLQGATCSVGNAPGVGDGIYLQLMIEGASNGEITYPDDYEIVTIPSSPGPVAGAMTAGQTKCHAMISPASTQLNEQGFPTLVEADDVPELADYLFFGISTTRSWAEEHPIAVQRFLEGYLASMAWLYDPANRERAVEILAENADLELDVADQSYDWVSRGGYPKDGRITPDNIRRTIEVQKRFGTEGVRFLERDISSTILDMSYLDAAIANLPDDVKQVLGI